jgi:hypothetical protein
MTPLQLEAFDYIRDRITLTGYPPSFREIAAQLHLSSLSAVSRLIEALVEAGKLGKHAGKDRGLYLTGEPDLRTASLDAIRAELARRGETLESLQARAPDLTARHARCAADTCGAPVQRGHLFCLTHWRALPSDLQSGLLAAHRRGNQRHFQMLLTKARDIADDCRGVA